MSKLIAAAAALADMLEEENAALAALDVPTATRLLERKRDACAALQAAHAEAAQQKTPVAPEERPHAEATATRLAAALHENQRLLERALLVQRRLLQTLAQAVRGTKAPGYAASGRIAAAEGSAPLALCAQI